jgi:hypothetical protein
MASRYVLEDVTIVENDFSTDSRNKEGLRIVSFDAKRSIKLHLAIDHIVQIEAVKDAKLDDGRAIVTLTSGHRYITRRSAQDLCAAIEKAGASP